MTSFIHRLLDKTPTCRKIQAADGSFVTLTPKHFIYIAPCRLPRIAPEMKFSGEVRVGDCLIKVNGEAGSQKLVPVVSNTEIIATGAYAPMTDNGVLVTNDILSSCHSVFKNDQFMDHFVYYSDMVKDAFGGVFRLVQGHLPGNVVELPWLIKWGSTHLQDLVISE